MKGRKNETKYGRTQGSGFFYTAKLRRSGGYLSLSLSKNVNPLALTGDERTLVFSLADAMENFVKAQEQVPQPEASEPEPEDKR